MPETATNTHWLPVMAQSMSGETIPHPATGGGRQGQSLPPPLGSSRHDGIARDGKASPAKLGLANMPDWGTGGASGSWAGWSAPAPPNPERLMYKKLKRKEGLTKGRKRSPSTLQAHEDQPEQGSKKADA